MKKGSGVSRAPEPDPGPTSPGRAGPSVQREPEEGKKAVGCGGWRKEEGTGKESGERELGRI